MRKLSHEEIGKRRLTLEGAKRAERNPISVLCHDIRSIYNIGSIFRTSDAALIEKLYLSGYTSYPPRAEIEKVALGSTESVPWEYRQKPQEIIEELRQRKVKIAALELTDASRKYYEIKKSDFPLCLILGNELTGVSHDLISISDFSLEIPQFGYKHSLNVSVAFGIAVFEMLRVLGSEI